MFSVCGSYFTLELTLVFSFSGKVRITAHWLACLLFSHFITPGACVGEWVCCCFRCLLARDGRDYGRVGQAGTRERSGREMWGNKWGEGGLC